jgi:hypothetical protein
MYLLWIEDCGLFDPIIHTLRSTHGRYIVYIGVTDFCYKSVLLFFEGAGVDECIPWLSFFKKQTTLRRGLLHSIGSACEKWKIIVQMGLIIKSRKGITWLSFYKHFHNVL